MAVTHLVVVALLAVAVEAPAQSHEPTPPARASAKAHGTAATGHEAAPAAGHGAGSAAAAPRKVPTVSRVAPLPRPPAAAAGTDHDSAEPHVTAPTATKAAAGYVATGARGRDTDGGHGGGAVRRKPVVSGMVAPHEATSAPAVVATAPIGDHDAGAAAAGAAAARRDTSRPARLSDVHERLRVALAEAHLEGRIDGLGGPANAPLAAAVRTSPAPRRPARITLTWPGLRWRVTWPAPGRVSMRWPEAGVEARAPVPAGPLTLVVPQD